ncbi:MAG: asparagine synthase C-terminal domain-containing protein [Gammaproteobacteria bacterium]
MSRFLETFPSAGPEHRVAPDAVQGRQSQLGAGPSTVQVFFTGRPWWEAAGGPAGTQAGIRDAVLKAYRAHGTRVFESARGHFAIAIVDHSVQRVLLGVDRSGVGALAWARTPRGQLVFGTSPLDVARHPDVAAGLSRQALFDYLYFHMVPSPGTVYAGVEKLRPAHFLLHEGGKTTVRHYWMPNFATRTDAPASSLHEELLSALRQSVARAAGAGGEVGAFLSGGLDSSSVAGMLAEVSPGPARTFSIGFEAEEYNELGFARLAAQRFKLDSVELEVKPADVTEAIPKLAAAFDEPFGNSSAVPTYWCARTAREHGVTHLLAGDGGDELFGGNKHYSRQAIFELYHRLPGLLRSTLCEGLLLRALPENAPFPLGKLRSYIDQARIPLPRRLKSWDFMFRTPAARVWHPDFLASIRPEHPDDVMSPVYGEPDTGNYLDRLLYFDWQFVLADNDLRKVNGACALAGVDVSYPMLDDEVVDFSLRLPPDMKVRGQQLRPFYKEATRGFLPDEILDKEKHGFGLPFGLWLKTDPGLRELVLGSLAALKGRQVVRAEFLDEVMREHQAGHASYYGYVIYDLVVLEQWLAAHQTDI